VTPPTVSPLKPFVNRAAPSWTAAAAATCILFTVYAFTLARGVTPWDAGEFLTAIHSLGIPHEPGTPHFVLVARVWSMLVGAFTGFTIAVNALSAVCTAIGCGILARLLQQWTRDPIAACAAMVCAGATSTLWLNATETEVYACAFLCACLVLWIGDAAGRADESHAWRWLVLLAYVAGYGWALHLTALLTMPAALYAAWPALRRRSSWRLIAVSLAVIAVVVGASGILFMWIRAQHDPLLNQGNPTTWTTLWDAVQRRTYAVPALIPRRAPFWLQLGNVIEYADWQFALGFSDHPGPVWSRTPITMLFVVLGVLGSLAHRRADVRSWRIVLILLVTTSLGVATYTNLRAGPTFGYGILPDTALREARERDYFFTWAFVCWGMWSGYGAIAFARTKGRFAITVASVIAGFPIVGNAAAIWRERHDEQRATAERSHALLHDAPPNAVFLAAGDNDTYPLWYWQEVHSYRRDVTVIPVPMMGALWYRSELKRRYALLDTAEITALYDANVLMSAIARRASAQGRPVVRSPLWPASTDSVPACTDRPSPPRCTPPAGRSTP